MPQFAYTAVRPTGEPVAGTLRSPSRREALVRLRLQGCHPTRLEALEHGGRLQLRLSRESLRPIRTRDLAVLTRQLAALLRAGLPLLESLQTLRKQSEHPRLARILSEVEETLAVEGGSLAGALAAHPRVFDEVYRGVVRAGEEGGDLARVLGELGEHQVRMSKLRGQVVSAFIYPAFLLVVGTAATFVLLTVVIPRFRELFDSFSQELPWPTLALLAVGGFLRAWWWLVLLAAACGAAALAGLLKTPGPRLALDRALLRVPAVGPMLLRVEMARIARTLAALLRSGVTILAALRTTAGTAHNRRVRAAFDGVGGEVSRGRSLADAAADAGVFPPLFVNLVRTGENSGDLPEMLGQLADLYEDEADRAITGAVKLLEPSLIVVLALVIGGIVAAVILPIFQANVLIE